jgi:peptide/nickel transport system substrate-binding protein
MISRHLLKLRIRRMSRRWLSQGLVSFHAMSEAFEKNGFVRISHLRYVRRFIVVWVVAVAFLGTGLLVQLSNLRGYYQVYQPVPGGRFTEGIIGTFTTANPLYAISDVNATVSHLLFAGLLTYDNHNQLTGNLAESWTVDPGGKVYTVRLRPNLTWQDGEPLTADDVVYTYHTIQNPDAQSPLFASWRGVTVTAIDNRVITFMLPNPLSSFPSSLTNGIVPQHLLGNVNPIDLRSTNFNTADPVGSGPFRWGAIGVSGIGDALETQISLLPFDHYWAGTPKLTNFTIHTFVIQNRMLQAYTSQQLTAVAGLQTIPDSLIRTKDSDVYQLPLTAGVYVFFETNQGIFSDPKVRQALIAAADRSAILQAVHPAVQAIDEPLLPGQLAYDLAYKQTTADLGRAGSLLDAAGWAMNAKGIRTKDGQPLIFTMPVADNQTYRAVASMLKNEWQSVGIDVRFLFQQPADFQSTLAGRQYDALLYGISIGADPDVFVYWDSSQNDPRSASRLNFSNYASATADAALESGRTRLDPQLRAVKYRHFLQAWQQDAPALALYQPQFLYVSHVPIYGLTSGSLINVDQDRYRNVQNWMIEKGWVTR